jgi:competence protein ComEA
MNHALRAVRAAGLALAAALSLLLLAPPILAADEGPHLSGVVNVNTATLDELQLLPGIGEARARALIEARKQRGGFKQVDDLMEVKGIGPAGLERMRPFVRLQGQTTARVQ